MDPDTTLARIRAALVKLRDPHLMGEHELDTVTEELAEHAEALDNWLASGGFLPGAWNRHTAPACAPQAHQANCDHTD